MTLDLEVWNSCLLGSSWCWWCFSWSVLTNWTSKLVKTFYSISWYSLLFKHLLKYLTIFS